jgi:tripartite-type tricarboxylate transporter receptor subunit TctC
MSASTSSGYVPRAVSALLCTAALPVVPRIAWAQAYPSRPVRIVVPFPAGQATDSIARLMGHRSGLGRHWLFENRTGAGGNIGTEAVVHAPPDGYTLLLAGLSNANPTLYKKLNSISSAK